jgi:hypothetical protein
MVDQEKSDVDKILDALDMLQTVQLAQMGDEPSFVKLDAMDKGKIPEGLKRWMEEHKKKKAKTPEEIAAEEEAKKREEEAKKAKKTPEELAAEEEAKKKAKEKPKEEEYPGKPKKEDFTDDVEYAKALIRWDTAVKAKKDPVYYYKKPKKEDFVTDIEFDKAKSAYEEFVKALKEDLEPTLGASIKKSLAPIDAGTPAKKTFKQVFDATAEARTFDEYERLVK